VDLGRIKNNKRADVDFLHLKRYKNLKRRDNNDFFFLEKKKSDESGG
jgi:hypothetical protein